MCIESIVKYNPAILIAKPLASFIQRTPLEAKTAYVVTAIFAGLGLFACLTLFAPAAAIITPIHAAAIMTAGTLLISALVQGIINIRKGLTAQ